MRGQDHRGPRQRVGPECTGARDKDRVGPECADGRGDPGPLLPPHQCCAQRTARHPRGLSPAARRDGTTASEGAGCPRASGPGREPAHQAPHQSQRAALPRGRARPASCSWHPDVLQPATSDGRDPPAAPQQRREADADLQREPHRVILRGFKEGSRGSTVLLGRSPSHRTVCPLRRP